MSDRPISQLVHELARAQRLSLVQPCKWLDCSLLELERRLDLLEPVAVREVECWLGLEHGRLAETLAPRINKEKRA